MKKKLLDLLCAPRTKNALELVVSEMDGDEIIEGELIDVVTKESFPIMRGIPRFVGSREAIQKNYAASFGYQWVNFNWLRDVDQSEFETITDRSVKSLGGKIVLDAGCGGGRIARFLSPVTKMYIGVDYSIACERAYELCRNVPHAHFIQADLNNLPFRAEGFCDFILSHGVLHHTPDTRAVFLKLPVLLRSGGELYIAVFRKAFFILRWSDGVVRFVFNKLPVLLQENLCRKMRILQRLPNPGQWKRFFWFSMEKDPEVSACCNFDWYAPKNHLEHTAVEVMNWFAECGFKEIQYINAWPYCNAKDKYRIPTWKDSFRIGQLLGVMGRKI